MIFSTRGRCNDAAQCLLARTKKIFEDDFFADALNGKPVINILEWITKPDGKIEILVAPYTVALVINCFAGHVWIGYLFAPAEKIFKTDIGYLPAIIFCKVRPLETQAKIEAD